MKLQILFNNDTPPVHYESPVASTQDTELKPIEVKVVSGGKNTKQRALVAYFEQLAYAFICVNNTAVDKIGQLKLSDIWFLNNIYKSNITSFGSGTMKDEELKYDIVIYDITAGTVTEKMYLTRNLVTPDINIKQHNKQKDYLLINGVTIENLYGNHLNTDIMVQQLGKDSSSNILGMIAITEKYLKGYHLKWNMLAKKLALITDDGSIISYAGIRENDVYSVIKLFSILLEKGNHVGVFYINVMDFTSAALQGLLALIKLTFGTRALVFLYNCQYLSKEAVERDYLELPNYFITEGKK